MKKAAIYDPFLDTLGGGEKYILTLSEALLENGWQVTVYTNHNPNIINQAGQRFNLNLKNIIVKNDIFKPKSFFSLFTKIKESSTYDLFIFLNDGSIPFLFSKRNILHVQVPFNIEPSLGQKILNLIKLSLYKKIIVNSKFTQQRVKKNYLKDSYVLYPPIDTNSFTPSLKKENIILSVGRFDNILNSKKQDVMIEAFTKMYSQANLKNWKYVLIGGSLQSEDKNQYLKLLKKMAYGFPIEFIVNASFLDLKKYYSISKIFWHAAGFDVDENLNPQQTEHFGMSTVEAMSAGIVPVVVNKGGLKESVNDGISGYLWNNQSELIQKTLHLINHPNLINKIAKKSIIRSQHFSSQKFKQKFLTLIE